MCLMDGLIIQAGLAEFESEQERRSVWDKHADRIALHLRAQRHSCLADKLVQVVERLLRRFLPELDRVFGDDLFLDRNSRR